MYNIPIVRPRPTLAQQITGGFTQGLQIANALQRMIQARHEQELEARLAPLKMQQLQAEIGLAQKRAQALGAPKPLSQMGKVLSDYKTAVNKFGQNSPEATSLQNYINKLNTIRQGLSVSSQPGGGFIISQGGVVTPVSPSGVPQSAIPTHPSGRTTLSPVGGDNPQVNAQGETPEEMSASAKGAFQSSPVGATNKQITSYVNPVTGEALSVLNAAERAQFVRMYLAQKQALPLLNQLKESGAAGVVGAPSVIGQTIEKELFGGDPEGPMKAARYHAALHKLQDVWIPARGLKGTVPQLEAAKESLKRLPGETSEKYARRIQEDEINWITKQNKEIENILKLNAIKIPGVKELEVPQAAQKFVAMPEFKTKEEFMQWREKQSPEALQYYASQAGG